MASALRLAHPPPAQPDRPAIRPLAPLLVNQIAAGEVIERPASIVKELIENALDAGAARITIELERGGLDRIAVIDDGGGIPQDQLSLALMPHATSKVAHAEDLDRIATLGFRGEALASAASVARLTLLSRTPDAREAWSIHAEGDGPGEPTPAAAPPGTRVDVRDLFFNTPARRKFLKGPQTERGRCLDWIRDLAMARPAVGFTVREGDRELLACPPEQTPRARAIDLLGRELAGQLLEVSADRFDDARGMLLWGLVGTPAVARANPRAQHVFLNGRTIRDKTIQHALREAYRGLIEPGRYPTAVLMLEMAPDAVDINVHPAKLEVRFRDQSAVHQAVLRAVRDALAAADLTRDAGGGLTGERRPAFGPGHVDRSAERFVERVRAMRTEAERIARPVPSAPVPSAPVPSAEDLRAALATASPPPRADAHAAPNHTLQRPERFMQVHGSYIVVEDDAGLLLIDQHALHERVMFHRLLERIERGPLESQRLLTPIAVALEADPVEAAASLEGLPARLGLELAPLGPRSLGVFAVPSLLFERGVDPADFTRELLDRAASDGFTPSAEAAMHEVLDMMACKAAIKAGDRLSEDEIADLLAQRHAVERAASCPHGRPTSIRLALHEIEKLFERR